MRLPTPLRLPLRRDPLTMPPPEPLVETEHSSRRALRRVLAFTGRSIDDVVTGPIAKNQVCGYYKVLRQVERAAEVRELENQWNPTR